MSSPLVYALAFSAIAGALSLTAWRNGGPSVLLAWPATSSAVFAGAYLLRAPGLLGKTPEGRIARWAWLLHLPAFLATWGLWRLFARFRRGACHEVAPGVWLGRRPFACDLPPGTQLVVDLTAEFPVDPAVQALAPVCFVPTLDGTAPDDRAALAALERALASPGPVYLHCAAGHGRSAALAAAFLVRRGVCADLAAAEAHLRRLRPGVRLSRGQRALAARLAVAASR